MTSEPNPSAADTLLLLGGSAGSLEVLPALVADLPADLPAAVLVTVHIGEHARSQLATILGRRTELGVGVATDGEELLTGRVYVAPPGRHLLVRPGHLVLSSGPSVNRHRPSIDVTFASAASSYGGRCVGVVLSGVLDDGAVGAALIDRAGGQVFGQADAEFSSMPRAALDAAPGARAVVARDLARACVAAVLQVDQHGQYSERDAEGRSMVMGGANGSMAESDDPAFLSTDESRLVRLSCPDCSGAMAQVDLDQISYFICHVGHRYNPQSLAAAQAQSAEAKLWSAVAALEEHASVLAYLEQAAAGEQSDDSVAELTAWSATVQARAIELRHRAHLWAVAEPLVQP